MVSKSKTKEKKLGWQTDSKTGKKIFRVEVATYVANNGDGSGSALFFRDEEAAEKYASKDDERMCEDTSTHTLVFDENGILLKDDGERRAESDAAWDTYYDLMEKIKKEKDPAKLKELKAQEKIAKQAWEDASD